MAPPAIRVPLPDHELGWAETSFAALAKELGVRPPAASECEEVWKNFCHVFLNRKELIYIY